MSKQSAEAFLNRMKSDKAFADRVAACKDPKARAALVKGEGYEFKNDELYPLAELDEAALAGVVGGMKAVRPCGGYSYAECC